MTTVSEAIREAAKGLENVSDTPRLDAELLMAKSCNTSRSHLLLHLGRETAPSNFEDFVRRRLKCEPVAYITGYQEFYGRSFRVTPDVLIPRADSETVIAVALKAKPNGARVLDCGVGSGALLVTYLLETQGSTAVGIDCSQEALYVAENNAQRLGIGRKQGKFMLRDWTRPGWFDRLGAFDLIVANPPYVETTADLDQSVSGFEPAGALFAGPDGLDDYRILIPQLRGLLAQGGVAVLEIGYRQDAAVSQIAAQSGFSVELFRDLAHRPRALLLR